MICPNCLANNKNNAIKCQSCGYDLVKNGTDSVSDISDYEQDEEVSSADDKTISISPVMKADKPDKQPSIPSYKRIQNTSAIYTNKETINIRKKSRSKRTFFTILTILIWACILVGIVLLVIFGWKWFKNKIADPQNSAPAVVQATPPVLVAPALIVQTDPNGLDYLQCSFFGQAGDSIYLTVTDDFYQFTSESLQINLYLKDIISESTLLESDTVNFNLGAKYRMTSGVMADVPTPDQSLKVQQTQIVVISPQTQPYDLYQNSYDVVFKVTPGSAVTINDINYTDKIDSNGKGTYKAQVEPDSSMDIKISARAPFHQAADTTVTLRRPPLQVPLTLTGNLPKTVKANTGDFPDTRALTITVSGTIDKEATLTIPDYSTESISVNVVNGTYQAKVILPNYGPHSIKIVATHPTKGTSSLVYDVMYLPIESDYTRWGWEYDPKIVTNPSAFLNKEFVLENVTVGEMLDAPTTMFKVNMGTEDAPQMLVIEYFGSRTIKTGDKIRIFGDVQGQYENTTKLVARFIYSAG